MRLTKVLLQRGYQFKFFKRYVEQEMLRDHLRSKFLPIAGWKEVGRKRNWYFDENRPWTEPFKQNNLPGRRGKRPIMVEPIKEWKIFKGDRVR